MAPIDNGTIHGDFEATILSGIATVQAFDSGFTQVITITVFGLDDENNTFFINEMGIRTNATQQITRAVSNVRLHSSPRLPSPHCYLTTDLDPSYLRHGLLRSQLFPLPLLPEDTRRQSGRVRVR